jgi:hypothetical protein
MSRRERGYERGSELRVLQSVLRNALVDLESGEYPTVGRLCEDIADLGYAQNMAVEAVFDAQRGDIKRRLAARVCESCISWIGCNKRVLGSMRMDEEDPLMMFEKERTVSQHGLVPIVTPTMRYYR